MKDQFQKFYSGLGSLTLGWSIVKKHRLWWIFIIPLFLQITIFWAGIELVSHYTQIAIDQLHIWIDTLDWTILKHEYFGSIVYWMIWIILRIVFFIFYAYVGGYVVLACLSPLLAWLSEKSEEIYTGKKSPFVLSRFLNETIRGIAISLRNMGIELVITTVFIALSFIPIIGLASPFCLMVLTAFFYGFSFTDYTLERHSYSIAQSTRFNRKEIGHTLGVGAIFPVILIIPILGPMFSGVFAMLVVVGSTVKTLEILDQEDRNSRK